MIDKTKEVNCLSLFLLGCSLLTVVVLFTCAINPAFISIIASGIGLMAVGIAKRDKWSGSKENKYE